MNFEPLVKVTQEQISIYTTLLEKEREKTDLIIRGKTTELDNVLNIEQALNMKINNIEKKRSGVIDGLGLTDKTFLNIISICDDDNMRKILTELYDKLYVLINEIQNINELNKKIINGRLAVINDISSFVYGNEKNPKTKNRSYTKDAKVEDQNIEFKIKKKI